MSPDPRLQSGSPREESPTVSRLHLYSCLFNGDAPATGRVPCVTMFLRFLAAKPAHRIFRRSVEPLENAWQRGGFGRAHEDAGLSSPNGKPSGQPRAGRFEFHLFSELHARVGEANIFVSTP